MRELWVSCLLFCFAVTSADCILKVRPPGEGACPEPLIRIVDVGPDRARLQCEVKGAHPRPAVQWQNSSGRVVPAQETKSEERGGRFYVTVRAIVSSSGDYSCVVTQEEFCHQISSTTFVPIVKFHQTAQEAAAQQTGCDIIA